MLIYLVKVNIALILLYGFYQMFCAKDTFFGWRRGLLLGIYAIAFLVPLMPTIDWLMTAETTQGMALTYRQVVLPELTVGAENAKQTWMNAVQWIYIGGVAVLLLRMLVQVGMIVAMIIRTKTRDIDGCKVHIIKGKGSPFSFFQWIFVNPDAQTPVQLHEILVHEQTHARQWHSIDVICSELFTIVCWMNPFAWLMKTEIRLNLEYLADHKVMESGTNKKAYQYHLLGLANQNRQTGLYNNFNLSHLKNRIKMMNKKRTRTTGHIKYALFAPLTAALLLVSNIETVARTAERLIYSTEESTPRPEREEVASFVNTVQGLVTFTITVTNSEGKPQPNVTLQIKPSDEVKTFKTNAEGKATIEVDMTTPKYVSLDVSSPKSSKHQSLLLSANKPNVTAIFDTDDDIAAYIKAGKQIRVKLQISNNDNQQLAGAELISSSTNAKATTNAHGEAQLTVGVGETIAINHKGYQEGKFTVKELCPIKDMENPELVRLLLVGEDPVYQIADNMPEFPGGMAACLQHLARNIKYPTTAQKEGTQGKVIVQMVIEKDGSVDHVSIVRSISPELDAEAARVVKSMPKWKPATVKDKTVRCRYTVPVTFKLQ